MAVELPRTSSLVGGTAQIVYYYLKETVGPSYIERLKTNLEPTVFDSINTLAERLASGEFAYTPLGPIDIGVLNSKNTNYRKTKAA